MARSMDTAVEVEALLLEGFRRMSPAEKLHRVFDMNKAVLQLARARIMEQYGAGQTEREVRLRLAALWLDRRTMIEAFGWDPQKEGY